MLNGKSFPRTYCETNGGSEFGSKLALFDDARSHRNLTSHNQLSSSTRTYHFTQHY